MSIDHTHRISLPALADQGDAARQLSMLEPRRFRGDQWLSADEVTAVIRSADDRVALLVAELERQRRENQNLLSQVEMLRHGTLPSTAPQGPDPMAVELAMRAQDEANRTIGEASAEGAEIIADARRQADDILTEAHRRAADLSVNGRQAGAPSPELTRKLQDLEERHAAALAAVETAQHQLARWRAYLSTQAEQLRANAAEAGGASAQLQAVLDG
jgi:cell division septum initiation protein DivIVA